MKGKVCTTGLKKIPAWIEGFPEQASLIGGSRVERYYNNPGDVLRYELYTKREFLAMGYSKENVELMTSCSSFKVDEVVAQCEAEETVGSIFRRIAELTAKLSASRLALRYKFSKKRLRKVNAVERELKLLCAALHKQQRLILHMTRVQDAPGYDKSLLRSIYYRLPLPFKRWRDTSEKGGEEELMFIPTIGIQHNFSNTKPITKCILLTDYSARSIPL